MSGSKRRGDEAILYVCVSVWVCLKERRDTTKWIGRQEASQRALPEVKLCPVSVTKSHLSHTNTHTHTKKTQIVYRHTHTKVHIDIFPKMPLHGQLFLGN